MHRSLGSKQVKLQTPGHMEINWSHNFHKCVEQFMHNFGYLRVLLNVCASSITCTNQVTLAYRSACLSLGKFETLHALSTSSRQIYAAFKFCSKVGTSVLSIIISFSGYFKVGIMYFWANRRTHHPWVKTQVPAFTFLYSKTLKRRHKCSCGLCVRWMACSSAGTITNPSEQWQQRSWRGPVLEL